ncbi:hypothetical protein KVT40_005434 [Elsinoe batatas]|uniref:BTB domain-containing protein n=1 Tax=Elsinoe batatas TaxID=2601811 RepID=A0A8K0PIC4_9PEZI|nr:hypothetical protein KVT40_005434 [Elsinoe batatas]
MDIASIAEEQTSPAAPITTVICEEGDIILAVDDPVPTRFLVSSTRLAAFSPVFKAWFSSRWREGQHLSPANPVVIQLEDEEAKPLKFLLCAAHKLPADLGIERFSATPDDLLELAMLGDKYDCCRALWQHGGKKLFYDMFWRPKDLEECGSLLVCCFLFRHNTGFCAISKKMVKEFTEPFEYCLPEDYHGLPIEIYHALEAQRESAWNALRYCCDELEERGRNEFPSRAMQKLKEFRELMPRCNLDKALSHFEDTMLRDDDFIHTCLCEYTVLGAPEHRCRWSLRPFEEEMCEDKDTDIYRYCRGMCLTCLKDGTVKQEYCTEHDEDRANKVFVWPLSAPYFTDYWSDSDDGDEDDAYSRQSDTDSSESRAGSYEGHTDDDERKQ